MRIVGLLLVGALLAGCAALQSVVPGSTDAAKAEAAGRIAGRSACRVALEQNPNAALPIGEALARAKEVIAAPDFTVAALTEAMAALDDPQAKLYGALLLENVVDGLTLAGVDTDAATVAPDSPLALGLGAAVKACESVVGVRA